MRRTLHGIAEDFDLVYGFGESIDASLAVDFDSLESARAFLNRLLGDSWNRSILRQIADIDRGPATPPTRTDPEIASRVAVLLYQRRVRLLRRPRAYRASRAATPQEAAPAPAPAAAAPKEKTWIRFRIVEEKTGVPIPHAELRVTLPDNVEDRFTTDGDGYVEIDEIERGTCDVTSRIDGATWEKTWEFVRAGDLPQEGSGDPGSGPFQVRRIERHKVRTGETIDSLARANGMGWKDLAKFNWKTDVPEKINKHLRFEVGCTKRDASGANYEFHDDDQPGIILIPKEWIDRGRSVEKTHAYQVRRPVPTSLLRLEDPLLGVLADLDVDVKYANGEKESRKTDSGGRLEVRIDRWSDDGNFADLEFETELRAYKIRVFIVTQHADSPNGAWQRLVNLGYVGLEEPTCEPPSEEVFAAALEAFQAHEGIRPTGKPDGLTASRLDFIHHASRTWGDHLGAGLAEAADADCRPKDAVS